MKYQMFLSDFDGTLLRSDGSLSRKNVDAIAAYRRAGGIFAVCTGRMLVSILQRVKELGLTDGLIVAYQGATVYDLTNGNLLKDDGFRTPDAVRVLRCLEKRGEHIHAYTIDRLYCNMDDDALRQYEEICGIKGVVCEHLSDMVEKSGARIVKILVMLPVERRERLQRELAEELGHGFFVTSSSPNMVEIMSAGQDKGQAVRFLSEYYQVPTEKIAAIGDQLNDLPLVEAAGGKFTVANGVRELKKIATAVASNDEDGVAEAILNYAMGEKT